MAASIWSMPALALDYRNAIAVGSCDAGGYMDYRMPSVRRDQSSSLQVVCSDLIGIDGIIGLNPVGVRYQPGPLGTDQRDMEFRGSRDTMKLLVADSGTPRVQSVGSTGRSPSGGVGDARQGIELSLLQSTPVRLADAAQASDDRQAEQWVWISDSSTAEPGIWVMLIAGFLAMCAVARRRILIS